MERLKEKIVKAGIDNVLFFVPMKPLNKVFGLNFSYKSSNDVEIMVPAMIDEKRYKVSDNYKIELKSIHENFGSESFYMSDLIKLLEQGSVKMFKLVEEIF